jgi:hypothetical protein
MSGHGAHDPGSRPAAHAAHAAPPAPPYREPGTIQTPSGRIVKPLALAPGDIDIEDIAHALARTCRFGGRVLSSSIYSVAQHSVLVSLACDPADALWGLLHDAEEAYWPDMPGPVKHMPEMAFLREACARAMSAIVAHFGLPPVEPPSVKDADRRVANTEMRDLMPPRPPGWPPIDPARTLPDRIEPWTVWRSHYHFLERYEELTGIVPPARDRMRALADEIPHP